MKSFMVRVLNGFVELPDLVKAGVTAAVVSVASLLFANLLALLPFLAPFAQFVAPAAAIIAAALIAYVQRIVPDAFGAVAVKAVEIVLLLLSMYGIGVQLTAMQVLPALLSIP